MNSTDHLVGKQLGDYRLDRRLASGGMSHIYLAEDVRLGRRAAVKVLTPDIGSGDDSLPMRFEREAKAVAKLEHDNIIPIYQYGEQDGLYFLAMRYIEGNDLSDELEALNHQGRLMDIDRALRILEQVAAALDYAHARGIVHRDVKPSNVLLGTDDKAVLSDFGLVLWQSVDTTHGTAFGTPRYISPEQATDSQSAVPQSDIYSLAVIVYEIVTGRTMFKGKTPMEVALAHITEMPVPPRAINPSVPPEAQNEILKALQKDFKKRHATASEFIDALKAAYDLTTSPQERAQQADASTLSLSPEGVPIAPAAQDSDPSILENWDTIPERYGAIAESPTAPAEPEHVPVRQRISCLRIVMVGLVLVIAIGGGVLLTLSQNQQGNNHDTAASGSAVTTPTVAGAVVGEVPLLLRYNERVFALHNVSEEDTVVLNSLQLVGVPAEEGPFDNASAIESRLAPGGCLVIKSGAETVPAEWGCDVQRETTSSADRLFWRADAADDTTFEVRLGTAALQICPTVGRAVERVEEQTCRIIWPVKQAR